MRDVDIMKAMKNCLGGDLANQYSTRLIKWKLGGKRLKEMEHLYNTYTDICSDDNLVKTTEQTYKSYMASISVDANKTAWKNMVEKDNHEWKQYIVTDEADSDFSKKFGIDMIPRFIVIDKNGIVRDINFMRPSSPNSFEELKKMLETYS